MGLNRRSFLKSLMAVGGVGAFSCGVGAIPRRAQAENATPSSQITEGSLSPYSPAADPKKAFATVATRTIPSTGEEIPAIGLGSWRTFNVGNDITLRNHCADVMAAFFAAGGRLIDSSPMYGSSQDVIGYGLDQTGMRDRVFSADKVWSSDNGASQIKTTAAKWQVDIFDLLQVHNMVGISENLPLLYEMKDQNLLRYVGVTTSHGRRLDDLIELIKNERLDFIQVTYNPVDREVENYVLPLAQERGMGVIVNRPFRGGELTQKLAGQPLPDFAKDLDVKSWAQLILKFLISHPAVTCPIPATTKASHASENMQAANGPLPDDEMRQRIAAVVGVA